MSSSVSVYAKMLMVISYRIHFRITGLFMLTIQTFNYVLLIVIVFLFAIVHF